MNKNILQLHSSAGLYGAESVILSLSKALKQTKYSSIVGCLIDSYKMKPELGKEAEDSGLDVEYFPMKFKLDPFVIRKIGKAIHQRNIQLIHAHGYKSNILGIIASKIYRIPIITTNHLHPPMPIEDKKLQFYSKIDVYFTMKRLDKIVAVSDEIRDKLISEGLIESKIIVIENGIEIDKYNTLDEFDKLAYKKSLKIDPNSFVIGTLGRLTPQKGHVFLLEAAKKVLSKNMPVMFLIVGDGHLKDYLEAYAKNLGISENIKFLGFRKDISSLLKIMDIFVMSSIDEGLPMAMLEAMAARTPVIVTSVGDIPKVIKDNENGILVEPRKNDILAEKIIYLLNNEQKRKEFSEKAFKTAVNNYSNEAMCKEYLKVYEEILRR